MQPQFSLNGLELTNELALAFSRDGILSPTDVQVHAFAPVLAGRHAALKSGTGTGKTLAYLLPLLQRAKADPTFRVVVMAPAPELAVQILRTVESYKEPGIKCLGLVGGGNPERQRERLKKHPQIMVGTPGRVLELIFARKIKTARIGAMVLDEVDEILSPQNEEPLHEICRRPEFKAQLLCVSATFGERAQLFMDTFMRDERALAQGADAPIADHITHMFVGYEQQRKDVALLQLLRRKRIRRAMVFVNQLHNVAHLYRVLRENEFSCVTLSATRDKRERELALQKLRDKSPCILIATDAAARGLDVKDLDWVIHYELARDATTYVHRAGRTGRAGRAGTSIVMTSAQDRFIVEKHARALKLRFFSEARLRKAAQENAQASQDGASARA